MADNQKDTKSQDKQAKLQENKKKSEVVNAAKKVLRDAKKG